MLTILNKTHTVELAIKKTPGCYSWKTIQNRKPMAKGQMLKLIISKTNTTDSNTREPLIKGFWIGTGK